MDIWKRRVFRKRGLLSTALPNANIYFNRCGLFEAPTRDGPLCMSIYYTQRANSSRFRRTLDLLALDSLSLSLHLTSCFSVDMAWLAHVVKACQLNVHCCNDIYGRPCVCRSGVHEVFAQQPCAHDCTILRCTFFFANQSHPMANQNTNQRPGKFRRPISVTRDFTGFILCTSHTALSRRTRIDGLLQHSLSSCWRGSLLDEVRSGGRARRSSHLSEQKPRLHTY